MLRSPFRFLWITHCSYNWEPSSQVGCSPACSWMTFMILFIRSPKGSWKAFFFQNYNLIFLGPWLRDGQRDNVKDKYLFSVINGHNSFPWFLLEILKPLCHDFGGIQIGADLWYRFSVGDHQNHPSTAYWYTLPLTFLDVWYRVNAKGLVLIFFVLSFAEAVNNMAKLSARPVWSIKK